MLNLNIEEKIYTFPMPIDPTYKVIVSHKIGTKNENIIITGITELEYETLKNLNILNIERGNRSFSIGAEEVLCYGDIDFDSFGDLENLDTFNWLNSLTPKGVVIPSNYDYENHECTSKIRHIMWTETWRPSVVCTYLHGCLGKPKFTLIFKELK